MAVVIDSGELPMLSKIDITKQPQREDVIARWIWAFRDADSGLAALEPVLREIEHYKLWELDRTRDPKEMLRQLGILKLADRFDGLPQMLDSYISRLTQGESAEKELRGIGGLCQAARDNPIAEHGGTGANRFTGKKEYRVDNVNSVQEPKGGNGKTYTLRRLARDNPDLLAKVESGELSANAAAIEAGFRKKLTPLEAARKAIAKLNEEDRATLVAELIE